jgi:hypothetical protein
MHGGRRRLRPVVLAAAAPRGYSGGRRPRRGKEDDVDRDIELRMGDKRIPLSIFPKQVILGTLLGLLGALKGVDLKQAISIQVGPARQ